MKNHIFIPITSNKLLPSFENGLFIDAEEGVRDKFSFNWVVDDRWDKEKTDGVLKYLKESNIPADGIYMVTDVIRKCKGVLRGEPRYMDYILSNYGVIIKSLLPLFATEVLGIDKIAMIDDDVIIVRDISHWFEYENAAPRDGLSHPREGAQWNAFNRSKLLKGELPHGMNEMWINSGTCIFSKSDSYADFIYDFYDNDAMYEYIKSQVSKFRSGSRGFGWVTEQLILSLYFNNLGDKFSVILGKDSWVKFMGFKAHLNKPFKVTLKGRKDSYHATFKNSDDKINVLNNIIDFYKNNK